MNDPKGWLRHDAIRNFKQNSMDSSNLASNQSKAPPSIALRPASMIRTLATAISFPPARNFPSLRIALLFSTFLVLDGHPGGNNDA